MNAAVNPVKTASGTANGIPVRSITMSISELMMTASRMRWYRSPPVFSIATFHAHRTSR